MITNTKGSLVIKCLFLAAGNNQTVSKVPISRNYNFNQDLGNRMKKIIINGVGWTGSTAFVNLLELKKIMLSYRESLTILEFPDQ